MRMNIRPRCYLTRRASCTRLGELAAKRGRCPRFLASACHPSCPGRESVPSGAAARPAAVNETVHKGSAVQTGAQSRSELTFQDQSITRLGEKTIFSVGGGTRSIELGSGQFLLYVPKNAGGAKVKMGSVTAAITG